MKKYLGLILWSCLVFSGGVQVTAFETDDAYNRLQIANSTFYTQDQNKDKKITSADEAGWAEYGSLDANKDGILTYKEFLAGFELPEPNWDDEVQRNVVYKRVGDEVLLMDIYAPRVDKFKKPPVFYYTHGGGWSGGKKEIDNSGVRPLFDALSLEGFVCVSVSYRVVKMWKPSDPVLMRDCVVDCRDGLRFLKKHEAELGIDMNRVVVFGSSAGGHIAQLLTWSKPDDFAGDPALAEYKVAPIAGVSWFGPCDFRDLDLFVFNGVEGKFAPDHWAKRITKQSGKFKYKGADEKTKKLIEEMSPVCYLNRKSAPLLHVHGDKDPVISFRQAKYLKKKAKSAGVPVEIQMVRGAGHGWWDKGIEPDKKTIEANTVEYILNRTKVKK